MTLLAFAIILVAAVLHASWNFATKKVSGNLIIVWLGLCLASIVTLPIAITIAFIGEFNIQAIPYVVISGIVHAAYFYLVAKCYQLGDISTVYPVARGTGVLGTVLIAYIFLHEQLTAYGLSTILIIVTGILLMGLKKNTSNSTAIKYAILQGCMIFSYSITDKIGINLLNPIIYISGMSIITALCLAPMVISQQRIMAANESDEFESISQTWYNHKTYITIIGLGSLITYLLILFAMTMTQVSYVVAAREFSVVIGSLFGFILLHEKCTLQKGISIAFITTGLILTRLM